MPARRPCVPMDLASLAEGGTALAEALARPFIDRKGATADAFTATAEGTRNGTARLASAIRLRHRADERTGVQGTKWRHPRRSELSATAQIADQGPRPNEALIPHDATALAYPASHVLDEPLG